jgi:miniconductance mechanosensitive channel
MSRLSEWLTEHGWTATQVALITTALEAVAVLVLSALAYWVVRRIVLRMLRRVASKTTTSWDDALIESRFLGRIAHLIPAVIIYNAAPVVFSDYPPFAESIRTGTFIYMAMIGIGIVDAGLTAFTRIYGTFEIAQRFPIQTVVQVAKLLVFVLGGIAILAIVLGKSPLVLFSGLGAFTAVLLLVFKDAILGFVAGIQLYAYDMVRPGDWIQMPSHVADGDVIDVSLTTVKVQNWDKTITTIPTYALVSESFRNWRGMTESGGRRIKRSVYIDINSIRFCDEEMLARFKRIRYIAEYVEGKLEELTTHNRELAVDDALLINGRHLTNIGTFRAYLEAYLRNHALVAKNMTFLVRQLQPTENGLPIEIYVFSRDQAWARYEAIQADIFDHVLAIVPLFDLRVFQRPTGADLKLWGPDQGST